MVAWLFPVTPILLYIDLVYRAARSPCPVTPQHFNRYYRLPHVSSAGMTASATHHLPSDALHDHAQRVAFCKPRDETLRNAA